jgi:hypothetical protein
MSVSFHLSSSVHKRYLFKRVTHRYVFSRWFPPAESVFCMLFSVVLTDVVMLLSLLYAPLVCIFPGLVECVSLIIIYSELNTRHRLKSPV